ncbi:UNVERIFIED_CONTAM: hypothetical protein BEN50_22980, partial [Euhalothece sp. KZN 001]
MMTYKHTSAKAVKTGRNLERNRLEGEQAIVWLHDPRRFDYVRETLVDLTHKRRRPGKGRIPGIPIGYALWHDDAESEPMCSHVYSRRVLFVEAHDRSPQRSDGRAEDGPYAKRGCPVEAVDPATVRPGVPGRQTARA